MVSGMAPERVIWFIITVILFTHSHGCLEQEKLALLQLKAFLVQEVKIISLRYGIPADDLAPSLEGWAAEKTEDCCRWERVTCDNTTGRVTGLELSDPLRYFGTGRVTGLRLSSVSNFFAPDLRRYWNMSLFLPFQELEILDLSANQLVGFVQNEGLEKLRGLHNLEVLILNYNQFNESVISSLIAGFSSLKSLNLAWNNFSSSASITGLCSLRHLQVLDLSGNFIRGGLPWCFSNLTSLEELRLSSNQLSGLPKMLQLPTKKSV